MNDHIKRISRRSMLKRSAVTTLLLAGGTGLYTWKIEPHWVEVVSRSLPIANLPLALAGKLLVQISDLHCGDRVDEAYLHESVRRVAAMKPAIVVITGDYISYHSGHEFD